MEKPWFNQEKAKKLFKILGIVLLIYFISTFFSLTHKSLLTGMHPLTLECQGYSFDFNENFVACIGFLDLKDTTPY